MIQHTQVYDYMIRSGSVRCKWNGTEVTFPVSIGMLPRRKENECSAYGILASENGGLRVQVFFENDTGFPVEIQSFSLETTILLPEKTPVFCNGYQSWSCSRMADVRRGFPRPLPFRAGLLKNSGDYRFAPYRRGCLHSWSYTYFEAPIGFTLLASLDESVAFTRFQFIFDAKKHGSYVLVEKDCEGLVLQPVPRTSGMEIPPVRILDFFMTSGAEDDCFNRYFDLFYQSGPCARINRSRPALAWDSWYSLFDQVGESHLLSTLKEYKVREIPLDYFIIGQGYEVQVGDWITPSERFPHGLKPAIQAIRCAGYKPGITLCPFICSEKSQLFRERRELIAADSRGRLLRVGKNRDSGDEFYLLDLYNPQAIGYINRCIRTLIDNWGVGLLKFDFLYAAGLQGGAGWKRTRAQAVGHALGLLRKIAGPVPVIACGVPTGSAFGLFEYVSVTPDLSASWDGFHSVWGDRRIRERESTLNAVVSAVGRRHLDGRVFSSDPGSFTLRKFKNNLSAEEQEILFKTCIIFGGLISSSDNIGSYSADALHLYRLAISHRPARAHDKKVLAVKKSGQALKITYVLRNELLEETLPLLRRGETKPSLEDRLFP